MRGGIRTLARPLAHALALVHARAYPPTLAHVLAHLHIRLRCGVGKLQQCSCPFCPALTLHSPFPPRRCIYELFHTVVAGNEFEIVLPKDEDARFIDALLKDSFAPMNAFANLRIENAKAYEKKDEVMIMGKVDASAGGRAKVSGHAKVNI